MNYKNHYEKLIERSKYRKVIGYVEKHHIIPKCLGGGNEDSNISFLTPEEHYLAHLLLVKIYPNEPKLLMAARYMCYGNKKNGERKNNKIFGWLRRKHAEAMRTMNLGKLQSKETIAKRSLSTLGKKRMPLSIESIEKRTATRKLKESGKKRKPRSEETKKKLSEANKGKRPTEETLQKIRTSLAMRPKLTCPHCQKIGSGGAMHYWHFDNCKFIHKCFE